MTGHEKIAEILIDAGADIEATQEDFWTPLHLAASNSSVFFSLVLCLMFKIKLNSSLMFKHFRFTDLDREKVVDLLIQSGADYDAFGESHRTPLYFAAKKGNSYLNTEKGTFFLTPMKCVLIGFKKVAEILIEAGADVNLVEDVEGVTPLHLASHNGIS